MGRSDANQVHIIIRKGKELNKSKSNLMMTMRMLGNADLLQVLPGQPTTKIVMCKRSGK